MALKAMLLAGLMVLFAACGGGADSTATTTPSSSEQGPEPTAAPTNTTPPETPSDRLTLEQLRSWCTDFNERGVEKFADIPNEEATWGDAVEAFEFVADELASVNPPEELEEFWRAWQRVMEVGLSNARQKPAGELMQDDEVTNSSEFMAANRALTATHIALDEAPDREAYNVALHCSG